MAAFDCSIIMCGLTICSNFLVDVLKHMIYPFTYTYYTGSPLTTVYTVITTKDSESLELKLCLAIEFNSTLWVAYGFYTNILTIAIPNMFGVIFGALQLGLIAFFPSSRRRGKENDDNVTDDVFKRINSSNKVTFNLLPSEDPLGDDEVLIIDTPSASSPTSPLMNQNLVG